MKKQKKLGFLGILTICVLAGLCFMKPMKTEAAAFKTVYFDKGREKVGGYYLWSSNGKIYSSKSKTGAGKVIAKPSKGNQIWGGVVSNGSTVYYNEVRPGEKNDYIYSVKTSGKSRKLIGKVKDAYSISGYYNGNLYISTGVGGMDTYRLNIKTKKAKRIIKKATLRDQYKQYMVFGDGYTFSGKAYIYNCKTGKFVKISNKVISGLSFSSGKVYYAEKVNASSITIKSCSLTGKNKKTHVKKLSADLYNTRKITSRYVYYMKTKGSKYKCYRYDMKTKKSKEISEKSYWEIK